MDNKMAEDAIKDAISNRRLAKQPYDAGLEEALEIILTPITELPDVQRLIIQIHQLRTENKKLKGQLENTDIEQISEAIHRAYCEQYKKKHNKEYWTKGDYSLLDEETKEFDRATLRAVLQALKV